MIIEVKIKERLDELGKSQGWLARATRKRSSYINRLANGKIENPRLSICLHISEILNCTVNDLWVGIFED